MALVEPAALVAELEEAPDVADVGVGHREVRPLPVHPHAEPARLLGLDRRVLGDAIATRAREAIEPVGLDLVLGVEPERLLDLDLDPQALAVEAVLVALILAERRVIALEEVLQRPPPGVVDAHGVVGRDRPVGERERRPALVLAAQLLERAVAIPALEHGVLERDVIGLGRDGCECGIGGHGSFDRSRAPFTAPAAEYADCPSRPLSLDATKTSRARARHRGSCCAARIGPCPGCRVAVDRAARGAVGARHDPAEPRDRDRPGRAIARSRRGRRRHGSGHVPRHRHRKCGRLVDGLGRTGIDHAFGRHGGGPGRRRLGHRLGHATVRNVFAVDTGAFGGNRCDPDRRRLLLDARPTEARATTTSCRSTRLRI